MLVWWQKNRLKLLYPNIQINWISSIKTIRNCSATLLLISKYRRTYMLVSVSLSYVEDLMVLLSIHELDYSFSSKYSIFDSKCFEYSIQNSNTHTYYIYKTRIQLRLVLVPMDYIVNSVNICNTNTEKPFVSSIIVVLLFSIFAKKCTNISDFKMNIKYILHTMMPA